jgi:uncharacterized membrane protein
MKYAFGPIPGLFMAHNDGGTTIFFGVFIVIALLFMALFTEFFRWKNHPEQNTVLKILKEKYARHEISADEYRERSMLLEDEYWLDADDPEMRLLKESYARCGIDSRQYVKRRAELGELRDQSSSASFKERHA